MIEIMLGADGRLDYAEGVPAQSSALGHSQRAAEETLLHGAAEETPPHEAEAGKATQAGGKAVTAPRDVERNRSPRSW